MDCERPPRFASVGQGRGFPKPKASTVIIRTHFKLRHRLRRVVDWSTSASPWPFFLATGGYLWDYFAEN